MGRWEPDRYPLSLYAAPAALVEAAAQHAERVWPVRYEDLVSADPDAWQGLMGYLELDFDPASLDDIQPGDPVRSAGRQGRRSPILGAEHRSRSPSGSRRFTTRLRRAWCRRYLDWIGPQRLGAMGYDHAQLQQDLAATTVGPCRSCQRLAAHGWVDGAADRPCTMAARRGEPNEHPHRTPADGQHTTIRRTECEVGPMTEFDKRAGADPLEGGVTITPASPPQVAVGARAEREIAKESPRAPLPPKRVGVGEAIRWHWVTFAIPVVLITGLAIIAGFLRSPDYTAEAKLTISDSAGGAAALAGFAANSESLAAGFSQAVNAPGVARPVARRLGLPQGRGQIQRFGVLHDGQPGPADPGGQLERLCGGGSRQRSERSPDRLRQRGQRWRPAPPRNSFFRNSAPPPCGSTA